MKLGLRIVGVFLLLMGLVNLGTLFIIELDELRSPAMFTIRQCLMIAAGIGFGMLRRWGPVIFFSSVGINWIAYFTIYEGYGSLTSLWLTVPIPLAIAVLCFFAWGTMSWAKERGSEDVA